MGGNVSDQRGSRDVFMMGTGRTRDEAATKALKDCGSIMGFNLSLEEQGHDSAAITSQCHITQCIAPASARRR
jgi:hypothetical protein